MYFCEQNALKACNLQLGIVLNICGEEWLANMLLLTIIRKLSAASFKLEDLGWLIFAKLSTTK